MLTLTHNYNDDTPLISAIYEHNADFVVMLLEQPNVDLDGAVIAAIAAEELDIQCVIR